MFYSVFFLGKIVFGRGNIFTIFQFQFMCLLLEIL